MIENLKISSDLNKHGMIKNKTHFLKYPKIDKKLDRHFIRGYFDGDGSIFDYKNHPYCSIIGNIEFIEKLQEILIKILKFNKTKLGKSSNDNDKIKYLKFAHKNAKKFRDYIYKGATIFLERKYNRFYSY